MKTVLKFFLGLFSVSIIAVGIIYFIYPGLLMAAVQSLSANGAGLEKKQIDVNGYSVSYYQGGDPAKPTLMLLHGFTDDKNSFVTSTRELSQHYHMLLPDLQGHGDNAKEQGRDYSIAGQAAFVKQLSSALGVQTMVIGGNSMGGHTAAAFASKYPENTKGLVLVNATGMQLESESVYRYLPEKVDLAWVEAFFEETFFTPPAFPKPVLQHLANQTNDNIPFLNSIVKQIETGADFRMNELAQSISAPTLVLWGQHDPIVPSQYGRKYAQAISNAKLVEFDNAGHAPQFEIPEQLHSELKAFMQSLN